jgi:hypothetical protein
MSDFIVESSKSHRVFSNMCNSDDVVQQRGGRMFTIYCSRDGSILSKPFCRLHVKVDSVLLCVSARIFHLLVV